jgi:hypothetical protein
MGEILDAIPHRSPFLFADRIVELSGTRIQTTRHMKPDDPVFQGHYPGQSIKPGALDTPPSVRIPGSVGYYLYTDKSTLRKRFLPAREAANTAVFLSCDRSSCMNAQGIVVDVGMSINYFDKDINRKAIRF